MKKVFYGLIVFLFSFFITGNIDAAVAGSTTTAVNVRSGASVGYSRIVTLKSGASVSLVNTTKYKGSGCSALTFNTFEKAKSSNPFI